MLLQELPDGCQKAAETWKIRQLFNDLEERHRMLNNGKGIGDYEKQYLCLLLSGIEPIQMSEKLYDPVENIRVKITQSGLYKTIERLTGGKINNWRDPIILFLNKGYRKSEDVKEKEETLLVMTCDVEVSEEILRSLEEKMKQILGANQMKIQKIERGSLIIHWQGSRSSCEQIEVLFREGVLSKRLGVPVLDVQVVPNKERVNFSQWFDNTFTVGWQTVTELLNPQQLQATARTQKLERGKLIDLRADLLSHSVVLLINLSRENDDSSTVEITLRVYPTGDEVYLPPSLKLLVLSNNEVFEEVTARSADVFMRCQFEGEVGENFSVQLVLGDVVVTEDFVI